MALAVKLAESEAVPAREPVAEAEKVPFKLAPEGTETIPEAVATKLPTRLVVAWMFMMPVALAVNEPMAPAETEKTGVTSPVAEPVKVPTMKPLPILAAWNRMPL